ncbi:MAG: heme NO-binding domain-containing protein [Actinobacteria bacterium]|nr:heme NO-binding domain-containing protein [Actinomycetota bacterium]
MKGIIFNLVEEVVTDSYGPDTWDELLDEAGLEGAYTSLGSYPDDDLHGLVRAASSQLDVPPDAVIRTIGEQALPRLATRYPGFFDGHDCRSFLLTLNDIIHPEVRKLYPGADVPDFAYEDGAPGELFIHYRSARQLCALAEGFILGAAAHFGETVAVDQTSCMHRGDRDCVLRVRFLAVRP